MRKRASTLTTIGMAVGILVIAGSVVGGIALAADRGRGSGNGPAGSTAPMSNERDATPAPTTSAGPDSDDQGDDNGGDQSGASTSGDHEGDSASRTPATPGASPTCRDDNPAGGDDHLAAAVCGDDDPSDD